MNLPESIKVRIIAYGDGAKGLAFQIARNDEHGVQVEARRERGGAPWVESWTSDFLRGRVFHSYRELREAVAPIEDLTPFPPQIVGVAAKEERSIGSCWICRGEWTFTVRVKLGWRPGDESMIPCCVEHLEQVKADPRAAIEARRKWIREHPVGIP